MNAVRKISVVMTFFILSSCATTKNKNVERDGSSFEKAIIAESISAEYEYARKVCPDCKFMGQALSYNDKIPYDILRFKKPDGETVAYYFDISSFFGK